MRWKVMCDVDAVLGYRVEKRSLTGKTAEQGKSVGNIPNIDLVGCRVERKEFLARKSAQVVIFKPLHLVRSQLIRRMSVAISVFLNPVSIVRLVDDLDGVLSLVD